MIINDTGYQTPCPVIMLDAGWNRDMQSIPDLVQQAINPTKVSSTYL